MIELIYRALWRVTLAVSHRADDLEHYGWGGAAWTGR
jgi:hypothetical protein